MCQISLKHLLLQKGVLGFQRKEEIYFYLVSKVHWLVENCESIRIQNSLVLVFITLKLNLFWCDKTEKPYLIFFFSLHFLSFPKRNRGHELKTGCFSKNILRQFMCFWSNGLIINFKFRTLYIWMQYTLYSQGTCNEISPNQISFLISL